MGAITLADAGPIDPGLGDPGAGHRADGGRRYALPALLVAGWAGLFAYCAAYLTEDLPLRPPAADADRPAAAGLAQPRRVVVLDAPEAPRAVPGGAKAADAARPATPPAPSKPAAVAAAADYVGTWGPTPEACGARSRRRGYLPATITPEGARAGRTRCIFQDGHRAGGAWVMAAACRDRGRRWSSQVRLVVEGDRLTWSSSRGTSAYIRCVR